MRTIRIDANKLFFITSPSFLSFIFVLFFFVYTRLATYGGHILLPAIVAYLPRPPCLA